MRPFRAAVSVLTLLAMLLPVHAVHTSAASAILIEAESGRILYEKNAHERRYIASITKLMTALTALDSGHELSERVEILPEYVGAEGSSMYLQAGETVTLETLLFGLLLASGNDAALAVAGFCGGTVEAFVAEMNRRAAQLGMRDTTFLNPSGLTEEGHCSTASDMAKLAAECLRREELARIVAARSASMEGRTFTNHNKLLWRYEGCIGMKTGYTERSGRTLISAARRGGMTLIAVTLCDPDDWSDHTAMLDWGFSNYERRVLCSEGERFGFVPVAGSFLPLVGIRAANGAAYPLTEGEQARCEVKLALPVRAPVSEGQSAGTAVYYLDETAIAACPLVYDRNMPSDLARGQSLLARLLAKWRSIA